ncbi:MAG TPA: type II toxin-antitoxin system YafQ family toxin [Candidatus Dormibacteraeota bacterium]|nr:type II toxin-antitoxin system YafQ family toxin [Candidatus Dormibacteraeota bacterium]
MKNIERRPQFQKHFRTRIMPNKNLKQRFDERVRLFVTGERGKPLNDHPLGRNMKGLRAFSVTGDIRVVYYETDTTYIFLDVGSHNQVY